MALQVKIAKVSAIDFVVNLTNKIRADFRFLRRHLHIVRHQPGVDPWNRVLGGTENWFHAKRFLAQFDQVLRHFDSLILSHEVRCRKPARQIYDILNEKTKTKPDDCLFIDDLHVNIQTAKDCGWDGIVYQQEMNLEKELLAKGISF